MVSGGDGLKSITIVPKGTGGVTTEAVKKVKVKGKLKNGKEIEYYPGEIVVFPAIDKKEPDKVSGFISEMESKFSLYLLSRSWVGTIMAFRFRILDDRDVIQVMYDIRDYLAQKPGFSNVVPNGLGSGSVEIPDRDWHVIQPITAEDSEGVQSGKTDRREALMKRNDFLRWGEIFPGKMSQPYQLNTIGIYLNGEDANSITYDDILTLANDEGGNVISYGRYYGSTDSSFILLFPGAGNLETYRATIQQLNDAPVLRNKKETSTGAHFVSWGVSSGFPDDPRYRNGDQWNISKIRAEYGWDIASGKNSVTVAIIDVGVLRGHEDLQANLSADSADCSDFSLGCLVGLDRVPDNDPTDPEDTAGHGTAVAGVAGAITNNGKGIAGMAGGNNAVPNTGVKLLILKVNHDDYQGEANAIRYAKDHNADVINLSWNWMYRPNDVPEAILAAATRTPIAAVVVGAADNPKGGTAHELRYSEFPYPYTQDFLQKDIIVVGASTAADTRRAGTNWGEVIHVYAPGDEIWSTTKDGGYANAGWGTSYAAPHVSGLAALIRSVNPNFTTAQVFDFITSTVDFPSVPLENNKGRINAYAALRVAQGYQKDTTRPPKPTNAMVTPGVGEITVTWTATDNDAIGECFLYRREASGVTCSEPVTVGLKTYCLIAEVPGSAAQGSTFTYTDTSLNQAEQYYYRIVAVDKTGNRSNPSAELGAPWPHTLPPAKVTALKTTTGNGKVRVFWTAPTKNADGTPLTDLDGYRVYYSTSKYGDPAALEVETQDTSADLMSLGNGRVYYIEVTALDTSWNESLARSWANERDCLT